jgi:hypothetical protein
MGDYKLVTPEGTELIITEDQAHILAQGLNEIYDDGEHYFADGNGTPNERQFWASLKDLFVKFRDANIGRFFR